MSRMEDIPEEKRWKIGGKEEGKMRIERERQNGGRYSEVGNHISYLADGVRKERKAT